LFSAAITLIYSFAFLGIDQEKTMFTIVLTLLYIADSFFNLFFARFQQKLRLSIAGVTASFRLFFSMLFAIIVLFLSRNIILSLLCWVALTLVFGILSLYCVRNTHIIPKLRFADSLKQLKSAWSLFKELFPVFISLFSVSLLVHSQKFAIDKYLQSDFQAYFNYILMPNFAITLMMTFVLNPIIAPLSVLFKNEEKSRIKNLVKKYMSLILVIGLLTVLLTYFFGCQVLGFVFACDLSGFKFELLILVCAGILFAYSSFFTIILTVMRKQNLLLLGYILATLIAFAFSFPIVKNFNLLGASTLYLLANIILFLYLMAMFLSKMRKLKSKSP
jgi:O-antigen/teichoic acid export membrane protein